MASNIASQQDRICFRNRRIMSTLNLHLEFFSQSLPSFSPYAPLSMAEEAESLFSRSNDDNYRTRTTTNPTRFWRSLSKLDSSSHHKTATQHQSPNPSFGCRVLNVFSCWNNTRDSQSGSGSRAGPIYQQPFSGSTPK
jgi:hypothetical protein